MFVSHTNGLVSFEIADDSPLALQITKRDLVADAAVKLAPYPQYKGYHDGSEWVIVRAKRNVKSRMGQAFLKGDLVLAKFSPKDASIGSENDGWTCWVPATGHHMWVPTTWVEEVTA